MTLTANPSIRRNTSAETAETLARQAGALFEATGVVRSRAWLSRTIRDFMAAPMEGMPFGLFLAARVELNARQRRILSERADLRYLLDYADPTGETAVRHVMKDRGW